MCDQQNLRSACAYAQFEQSSCWSLEYSMSVKLLTENHLEFLSLKGGCTRSSESTLVKMPHCWKSHVVAQFIIHKQVIVKVYTWLGKQLLPFCGRFTFERIHNAKEQIYFYERAENHKAKERLFE